MNGMRAGHAAHTGAERLGVFTGMLPGASKPIRNVNRQFVNRGVAGRGVASRDSDTSATKFRVNPQGKQLTPGVLAQADSCSHG